MASEFFLSNSVTPPGVPQLGDAMRCANCGSGDGVLPYYTRGQMGHKGWVRFYCRDHQDRPNHFVEPTPTMTAGGVDSLAFLYVCLACVVAAALVLFTRL